MLQIPGRPWTRNNPFYFSFTLISHLLIPILILVLALFMRLSVQTCRYIMTDRILANIKRISANGEETLRLYTEYTSMHMCFSHEMVPKQAWIGSNLWAYLQVALACPNIQFAPIFISHSPFIRYAFNPRTVHTTINAVINLFRSVALWELSTFVQRYFRSQ